MARIKTTRLLLLPILLAGCVVAAQAIEIDKLQEIGAITGYSSSPSGVIFNCSDKSQLQVSVMASDLVRIRVSYLRALPTQDHSWAIARSEWQNPGWKIADQPDSFIITTSELQVVIHRSRLVIEFRDARTGHTINADARPMMFDPKSERVAAAKKLGFDEHFYGMGEKAARLDKRRGQFMMWNSDTPGYSEGTDPIYQSIPFYIGLEQGAAYGIFFDNSYRSEFDFGRFSQDYVTFSAEGGEMNYYFFWGPSIKKILARYADLTGHMPLPPLWALGNQQSRYSYYPDTVAEEVVRRYRAEDLPLDVLYLDIHYMDGYRVFTWDRTRFPNPKAFTDALKQQGVKVVTIVDPGVKHEVPEAGARDDATTPELGPHDRSYYVYNQGTDKDYFLRRRDGSVYIGKVWPGESVFADFTLEGARRWWGDLHRAYTSNGVAGIWNDMNEPSDFVDQTGKSQMNVVSYDEGERSTHAKNRNVFALLMARATYEGLERLQPDMRPYVITRAGYAGIQRYSTMWTGDNTSTWDSMSLSIPMFQSLGLSGEIFVGTDVGGFMGRTDGELLTRWYQIGFLTPFCRNHKEITGYDDEPWRLGKYYEDIIRKYLKLRYRLLPFLYSALEEGSRSGIPIFRPLLLEYQEDPNTLNLDDEFMVGSDLLVAPVLRRDLTGRMVYLPRGIWIDYWSGKRITGGSTMRVEAPLDTVPMFVRAGAIIPMGPEMNYVGEHRTDPLTFVTYPDDKGHAQAAVYEDDGVSPAYKSGAFRRTRVTASQSPGGAFVIELSAPEGTYDPGPRSIVFLIKSLKGRRRILLDDKPLAPTAETETKPGWYLAEGGLAVRITDDGKPHHIEIR